MSNFAQAVAKSNYAQPARTENNMKAHVDTSNAILDLFNKIGSARGVDLSNEFNAALAENAELAIRVLLWSRDVREGAGERQTFRNLLEVLDRTQPSLAERLIPKIPELGRWDDLFVYKNYLNRLAAFKFYANALLVEKNGLAAKWAPRKGPIAVELTKFLKLTPKQYRKLIVGLTNVVETAMCAKEYEGINFSHVPSRASALYQKAFGRNAPAQYAAYLSELQKPESERDPKVKINAGAVFPHDVVKSAMSGNSIAADAQWDALPNYVGDAKTLPMVDVSGSMGSFSSWGYSNSRHGVLQPIEVAVSLGLYLSGKNTGAFKDLFLTFSAVPQLNKVSGTLTQRISQMNSSKWDMNTNLHAAFNEILRVARAGKVSQLDMPETLLILSDMQFDQCVRYDDTALQMIQRKYAESGYTMPKVVFWNLNSSFKNAAAKFDSRGVAMVSGFSPAIMKSVLANDLEEYTPYNVMLKTILVDRYAY